MVAALTYFGTDNWVGELAALFVVQRPSRAILPYFLWLTAAATFLPPVANDYSLVFLPLAIVAIWDRRDPTPVHMVMGLVLLWWQPWQLDVSARVLILLRSGRSLGDRREI